MEVDPKKTEGKEVKSRKKKETKKAKTVEEQKPKPTEEEKPIEQKPKPTEEKPAEEKPAEEKPAEEKPIEEKPAEEKPAEEKKKQEKKQKIQKKPISEPPTSEKQEEKKEKQEKKETIAQPPVTIQPISLENVAVEIDEVLKKRGRKPRGGKLIMRQALEEEKPASSQNVILHLKCSLKDLEKHNDNINKIVKNPLQYDPNIPPEIMTFDVMKQQPFSIYEAEEPATQDISNSNGIAYMGVCKKCNETLAATTNNCQTTTTIGANEKDDKKATDIHAKIKDLKINYYRGDVDLSRPSCCFWCTYDFTNAPYYIPRQEVHDSILVYGNFCTPECAVAFLFKENIDDHTKFERYHFINKFYSSAENYSNSIRPAPNPFYILDRFMGTLTIGEYRKMLKTQVHSLVVIDKPMTRILPEIHTDNDTVGSTYKIKRAEKTK